MKNLFLLCLTALTLLPITEAMTKMKRTNHKVYEDNQKCTSIGVGKSAMADGSTVTTHNNDCQECDIRITHVPAMDWPTGSLRPIHDIRDHYPRYFEDPGSDLNVHGPDYDPIKVDTTIYNWSYVQPIGFIDQVPHTYAYTLGTYAIQNEKQVSIGESTCSAKFVAKPVNQGGRALFHMETLTEIALERCDTARCAITTMGDLASQFGFYGGGWNGDLEGAQDEAGEALTISDPNETWMFHLMADDTGTSAIWVAQRVPDDHITAVANQFVITTINLDDKVNFMASSNIFDVAIRANLWSPATTGGKPFDFNAIYGNDRGVTGFACTRRVWRVFTLAAPSLLTTFQPYTDGLGTFGYGSEGNLPYPFSVKPDKPLTVQDIMNMNRDQYEGTQFDLTKGPGGGPYGDPMRWPAMSKWVDKVEGISRESIAQGLDFQRPISLWRTAYSTVTQSRSSLPDAIGALTWIAPYAPHHSSFVPVYASASWTPPSMNIGTQYKFDKKANWWIHCMTSNYLSRWYVHTIGAVVDLQKSIEDDLFAAQIDMEKRALVLLQTQPGTITPPVLGSAQHRMGNNNKNNNHPARKTLSSLSSSVAYPDPSGETIGTFLAKYHEQAALKVKDKWWNFFFNCVGRFRDMYEVVNPHVENFIDSYRYLGAPRWWYEQIGFWGAPGTPAAGETSPVGIHAINVPSLPTPQAYAESYPQGMDQPYPWTPSSQGALNGQSAKLSATGIRMMHGATYLAMSFIFVVGTVVGGAVATLCCRHYWKIQPQYIEIK